MSFFGFLLLCIFIYFVALPIFKVWQAVRRARRQARELFGQGTRARRKESREPQPQPRPKRKKIDPNVGEYVDFEDVPSFTSTEASYTSTTINYQVEEQISDAEWEEIKSPSHKKC